MTASTTSATIRGVDLTASRAGDAPGTETTSSLADPATAPGA